MIAYDFPPSSAVGRMRTLKFCKYLPELGWQPVVLAPAVKDEVDPSLHEVIPPQAEVHRCGRGDHVLRMLAVSSRIKRGLRAVARLGHSASGVSGGASPASEALSKAWLLYWPDPWATWIPVASSRAITLARTCDALYTTSWPVSTALIGHRVAGLTNLPWVMDLRDPWRTETAYPTGLQRGVFTRLKGRCVDRASRVVNVNEVLTSDCRRMHPRKDPSAFVTIYNGFDPDDFPAPGCAPAGGPLRMTYLGTLYGGRSPLLLMEAMAELIREGKVQPGQVRLAVVGPGVTQFADVRDRLGLRASVDLRPAVPYAEALGILAGSHVAVFLGGGEMDKTSTPTKLFEYAFMRKPILAVLLRGPLWEQLVAGKVRCIAPDDLPGAKAVLSAMLLEFRSPGGLGIPQPFADLARHSRRHGASQLAGLLDELAGRRQRCGRGGT
jgi:hypothetical protein